MFISPIYSRYIHMFPSEITIFAGKSSHSQWLKQIIPLDTNKGLKKKLLNLIESNQIPKENPTNSL
jgi:hypothetical protein